MIFLFIHSPSPDGEDDGFVLERPKEKKIGGREIWMRAAALQTESLPLSLLHVLFSQPSPASLREKTFTSFFLPQSERASFSSIPSAWP